MSSPSASEMLSPAEQRFDRIRRRIGFVAAPVIFILIYVMTRDHLSASGQRLSAILACVAVLWITESLPLPVTSLLGAALCVILGVAPARQVFAYFADPIVFLFLGSFILARAMTIHGLDRRIALSFLSIRFIAGHPARLLAGMGLITALLSMWVSNTATTAMMLPIGLGVLGALHQVRVTSGVATGAIDLRAWPFATGMMLMIAYAASIGGIGTPVGSPPNLIGIGLIRRAAGREINFLQWMMLCVPMFVLMAAALFILLYRLHPSRRSPSPSTLGEGRGEGPWPKSEIRSSKSGTEIHALPNPLREYRERESNAQQMSAYIARERAALGPWTLGQLNTLIAFAIAVTLWIVPGILALPIWGQRVVPLARWFNERVPEALVSMLAAILLFILPADWKRGRPTLTWSQAVTIDWGTILLFGGGLALGTLMFETGVAHALGESLTGRLGVQSIWTLTFISIALGIVLSEATSNTASANMIVPVVIGIAQTAGVSPIPPALGACLGASFGFMLPVSTPPNAIVYGSGLVSIPSMMRAGFLFDLLGLLIIWSGLRVLCPILGLM